jgi:hypothetical protein
MVELTTNRMAPPLVVAPVTPATPAIVAGPTETDGGRIRYSPQENMVELVDEPRPADAAIVGTNAMGASPSAVGQPVRVPRIDARPLESR